MNKITTMNRFYEKDVKICSSLKRVLFEKGTLDTEVGQNIFNMIKDDDNVEIIKLTSNKIKGHIPGENLFEQYREGKKLWL